MPTVENENWSRERFKTNWAVCIHFSRKISLSIAIIFLKWHLVMLCKQINANKIVQYITVQIKLRSINFLLTITKIDDPELVSLISWSISAIDLLPTDYNFKVRDEVTLWFSTCIFRRIQIEFISPPGSINLIPFDKMHVWCRKN